MAKKTNNSTRQIYVKPEIKAVVIPDALMYINVSMDKAPKKSDGEEDGPNRPEAKHFDPDFDWDNASLGWDYGDLDYDPWTM